MITIVKGADRTFDVYLVKESDGRPYDLTDYTSIKARLENEDRTILEVDDDDEISVIGANGLGHLRIALTDTQTALLRESDRTGIEIEVNKSSDKLIVQIPNSIRVIKQLFT